VLETLRWLVPAVVPAALVTVLVYLTDKRREPPWLVATTFVLGAAAGAIALLVQDRAEVWTGLSMRTSAAGHSGALLFLFAIIAPVREAAKVAACWPAFRSKHFDEPYDGIVYSAASALGFAAVQNGVELFNHPDGGIWLARAGLALPAHLFFASAWGYALGRAKQSKRPGAIFPAAWLTATLCHALYIHLVYGRGQGAIIAVVPLLLAMGVVVLFAARDLRRRGERDSHAPTAAHEGRLSRESLAPGSLRGLKEALTKADEPLKIRWIVLGAFVTIGAMLAGLAGSVALGHFAQIDFAAVDERDLSTAAPVALLGAGLLAAFPLSGFLVARASSAASLLEPALAAALALLVTLVVLGIMAPVVLVFALAFSPVAWGLACAGAWVGRPAR
jgi:RsiW-degrading membrane proteinase PrsW (M82 family)